MKIVMDTNVLVSAMLSPYGAPAQIISLVLSKAATPYFDERILNEYKQVLSRPKFKFNSQDITSLIDYLEISGHLTVALPWPMSLPDPDDAMFLEVALASSADYLITGNLKHFPKRACQEVTVVTPSQLIKKL